MMGKLLDSSTWLPGYALDGLKKRLFGGGHSALPAHIFFCLCDHFEPYWEGAADKTARARISRWLEEYPKIAERFADSDGRTLRYSFFYPAEEYRFEDLQALATLCHAGYGEVEIHLHHENDTSEKLEKQLSEFRDVLHERHGLLSLDSAGGGVSYGFIHGNWALDNSRPDRRWCGVNDELSVLAKTGCYADFTMPSAPSSTQTRKINSIYRAVDDPLAPKSHDTGIDVTAGKKGRGLLMIQGPLCLNWSKRKFFFLPGIENSGLYAANPPSAERVKNWILSAPRIGGYPGGAFLKLYTHGAQEPIMKMLFNNGGLANLLTFLKQYEPETRVHFLSAREMANIVLAIEEGAVRYCPQMRDHRLKMA